VSSIVAAVQACPVAFSLEPILFDPSFASCIFLGRGGLVFIADKALEPIYFWIFWALGTAVFTLRWVFGPLGVFDPFCELF